MYVVLLLFLASHQLAAGYNSFDQERRPTFGQPPTIYQGPQPSLRIYRVDENVDLLCAATGTPKPRYSWLKNGVTLDLTMSGHVFLISQGSLRISHATALDEGFYQCLAENEYGTAMSSVVHLRRAMMLYYQTAEPREYRVREGHRLHMECSAPRSVPNATFSWSIARDVDPSPTHVMLNKRIQIDAYGNLHFAYVKRSDLTREGFVYKCNVFNPILDLTTTGAYSTLDVQPNERVHGGIVQSKPEMFFSSSVVIALEKRTTSLRCFFSGYPEPTVTWRRSGKPFPTSRNRYVNYNTEVIITDVQQSDEGIYICHGSNSNGDSEHNIYVDVQAAPVFLEPRDAPRDMNVTSGDSVTIRCRAHAEPRAHVVWYHNGKMLNLKELPPNFKKTEDDTVLTLRKMCRYGDDDCTVGPDNGPMVIQCNASNEHGYAFANGYINVLAPTVITNAPQDVEFGEYNDVMFICDASTDPSTTLSWQWLLNNQTVARERNVRMMANGSLLLKLSDDRDGGRARVGVYQCNVTNGFTWAVRTARLFLPFGEPIVTPSANLSSGSSELLWIGLLLAFVLMVIILLIAICFAQRHHTGTYRVDEKERKNGNDPVKDLADQYFHEYTYTNSKGPSSTADSRTSFPGSATLIKGSTVDDDLLDSSMESGNGLEDGRYNEDGSFIGQYMTDKYSRARNGGFPTLRQ